MIADFGLLDLRRIPLLQRAQELVEFEKRGIRAPTSQVEKHAFPLHKTESFLPQCCLTQMPGSLYERLHITDPSPLLSGKITDHRLLKVVVRCSGVGIV